MELPFKREACQIFWRFEKQEPVMKTWKQTELSQTKRTLEIKLISKVLSFWFCWLRSLFNRVVGHHPKWLQGSGWVKANQCLFTIGNMLNEQAPIWLLRLRSTGSGSAWIGDLLGTIVALAWVQIMGLPWGRWTVRILVASPHSWSDSILRHV